MSFKRSHNNKLQHLYRTDNGTYVLLTCLDGASKNLYREFLHQLEFADEQTFVTVINNFLTVYPDTLLMPDTFTLAESDAKKITVARQLANLALRGTRHMTCTDGNTPPSSFNGRALRGRVPLLHVPLINVYPKPHFIDPCFRVRHVIFKNAAVLLDDPSRGNVSCIAGHQHFVQPDFFRPWQRQCQILVP